MFILEDHLFSCLNFQTWFFSPDILMVWFIILMMNIMTKFAGKMTKYARDVIMTLVQTPSYR